MDWVRQYADDIGGHAYRPQSNVPFDADLHMRHNARIIRDAINSNRQIIDIGPAFERRAVGRPSSPFYNMERRLTAGYSGYTRVFERSGNAGGVRGLDFD